MKSIAASMVLLLSGAASAVSGYQLFPVRGVFFTDDNAASLVDPSLLKAVGAEERSYFATKFRGRFPQAADTISEGNQRRTYAVSLQLARASRYAVKKVNGTVDVYLPVTASLYFNNVMTGEVLYSATRTTIKTVRLAPAEWAAHDDRFAKLFKQTFRGVVDDLIEDARARFQPARVGAKVVQAWKGLAILDGGAQQGLARDDALVDEKGNELRVVSCGATYAVARVDLGMFSVGTTFSKISNLTLAEIRKPRLLPIVDAAPAWVPGEALLQLFSDSLGAEAQVSLVPVNRTFGAVVRSVGEQIDLTKEKLSQRELPQFFVRLHVLDPISYERPTNLAYKTLRVTEALAYAEVVDRSGRVIYGGQGRDHIVDEITEGMTFDVVVRKEIAIKNALLALATRFSTELKFETIRLKLTRSGANLIVDNERGILLPATTYSLYRNLGRVDGIAEDVHVGTWTVNVNRDGGDETRVRAVEPLVPGAPAPEEGDVVILEDPGTAQPWRKRFGPCSTADQLGPIALPEYRDLALNLFTTGYRAPFYATGLAAKVRSLVRGGAGFKADLPFREPTFDYCVEPAYRVSKGDPSCSGDACADVAEIQVGYRIRGGGDGTVKASSGLATRMTGSTLPAATTAQDREAALHVDILDQVLKLASSAAAGFAKEKL